MNQEQGQAVQESGPPAIGGWLIVFAIGLLLSPVSLLLHITGEILPGFRAVPLDELGGGIRFYLILNLGLDLLLLVFVAVVAFLFLQRRRIAPRLIISLYVLNILLVMLDRFVFMTASEAEWTFGLVSGLVSSAIWIPYFLVSQRVRSTFVG